MKTTPKDFFLNLGILVAFYWTIIAVGNVLFGFIDLALPDVAMSWKPDQPISVFALASIIVAFPVLIVLSRMSRKDIQANPDKMEQRARKWMIYLSLFVAGLVSAGDVIGIIYGLLSGDLVMASFLKMLIILVLAISSFIYLFRELKIENIGQVGTKEIMTPAIVVAVILVVFGIIASNPVESRERRLDNIKVNNLYQSQSEVEFYFTQNGRLPESITFSQKGEVEYSITSSSTYQLCAEFNRPEDTNFEWKRIAGRNCFDRSVESIIWKDTIIKR